MNSTLRKISIRKIVREKGKSTCIVVAIFLTTVMFISIFSIVFFVMDALEELAKRNVSWMADAAFLVTDEEFEKIKKSKLVSDISFGFHIGEISNREENTDIELVYYEEKMAYWMKCYPTKGRMPRTGNEIVVSDKHLERLGIAFSENERINVTYSIDGVEYTDTFLLVGVYDWNIRSKHVMMATYDFYDTVRERLEQLGKNSDDIMGRTTEVMFTSSQDTRKLTFRLMEEIGFDYEKGGYTYNKTSFSMVDAGMGIWLALVFLIMFVMFAGYLFISNIFQISMIQDAKFYGKLATIGVNGKEIKQLICQGNIILYFIAVLPAILVGHSFSGFVLPNILNSFFTFQVQRNNNPMIFILSLLFSYGTLVISERKVIKAAQRTSPIEMRRFIGHYPEIKKADNRSCLRKLAVRSFWSDREKALKIIFSIAISMLLANTFYTLVKGFDEEEYTALELEADYTIAKESFFTEVSTRNKENMIKEDMKACSELPGVVAQGGGAVCYVNVPLSDEVWAIYDEIAGKDNLNNKEGKMLTYLYGLDDIMINKIEVKEGILDMEEYHKGNYVLVDALNDNGETCFKPGDSVTIPFSNNSEKTYIVLAVVELPFHLSYQSKWAASSNIFLPMEEWQKQTGRNDYYMYTFDVEKEYHKVWDDFFSYLVEENDTLQYKSARTAADEAEGYIRNLKLMGLVFSMILVCMGIMNYVNCMANNIYSRRKEFAILQSMGMGKAEIIKVLIVQGTLYMSGSLFMGMFITIPAVYFLIEKWMGVSYLKYSFHPQIYILFVVAGIGAATIVPLVSYMIMDKQECFLERIRMCKE